MIHRPMCILYCMYSKWIERNQQDTSGINQFLVPYWFFISYKHFIRLYRFDNHGIRKKKNQKKFKLLLTIIVTV